MNVLGLIAFGQSPAAALLQDGRLVAFAEEERFTRLKGSDGLFPTKAVAYCLSSANLPLSSIDRIAFGWDSTKYPWAMLRHLCGDYLKYRGRERRAHHESADSSAKLLGVETLIKYHPSLIRSRITQGLRAARLSGNVPEIEFVPHHLAHACSAFFSSPFEKAGILTMDGSGEEVCTQLAVGKGDDIQVVESIPVPHSLGWFYAAIAQYLGFLPYRDEGKLMGLAALGEQRRANNKWLEPLSRILKIRDGYYEVDPVCTMLGGHFYGDRFTDELVKFMTRVDPEALPISYGEKAEINGRFQSKYLLNTYVDIAWAAQELLEQAAVMLAKKLVADFGVENLCLAGGVALNCKMNGEVLRQSGCANIFVQPAANDAGAALGAAMHVAKTLGEDAKNPLSDVYYGPGFPNDQIHSVLRQLKIPFARTNDPSQEAAKLVAEGKIIAWFQGRMEFGSRALGGRSILANATLGDIKDKVNAEVKYREGWRPFCPSMMDECKEDFIEAPNETSFMTVAYHIKESVRSKVPSIVHVDGTVRPQTVTRQSCPLFHSLLENLERQTGCPLILNTSFNVRGEPIICSPLEAIRCFYSNGLDALVMGDFILRKG